ncbi:MAG TPA: hypothetical protein VNH15_01490 [Elusimicrobiota bacterium]|nr:hypothetical protein [Elusimicrobiota bacterium]
MKRSALSAEEKSIERALLRGAYKPVGRAEFRRAAQAIARRKKDAVLNIRVNRRDIEDIKRKAGRLGVPYQSLISEMIHQLAA